MYTDFYKLSGRPFQLNPNPRFFFNSRVHQKAVSYLQYGLHQGEGFIVITGDIGTGKTTLLGYLISQLDSSQYVAAKLVTTQLEADDTLRMVASAFGIDAAGIDKATLLRRFEQFLLENQRRGRRLLVLVDEVQNLPFESLEELRMLSNFQVNDVAPIQFCLLGQPQFQEIIASESLTQLRQRVVVSYHLGPLSSDETRTYIEHRLRMVDWQSDPTLSDKAFERIHHYTGGVPRRINVLCDRLLLYGMLETLHELDADVVEVVSREMVQEARPSGSEVVPARTPHNPSLISGPAVEDPTSLEHRLASLEKLVGMHDRTIKRAIELIASYLNANTPPERDFDKTATARESGS
jgi:general secretion pathway protein A